MTTTKRQRLRYILTDLLSGNIAWFLFNLIRYYTLPYNYFNMSLSSYFTMTTVVVGQILFPILLVAIFAISGFYNQVFFKSRVDIAINTFGISLMGAVVIFFAALFNDSIDDRLKSYEMVLILWLLISVITVISRYIVHSITIGWILSHRISFNAIVIGTSEKARKLANDLEQRYPYMGFNVVAFADEHNNTGNTKCAKIDKYPIVNLENINNIIDEYRVDAFILSNDTDELKQAVETINKLFPTGKSIYISPNDLQLATLRPRTQMVSGEVLIDVSKSHVPASTINIKRISDIIISLITLIVISPLLAVIALMVKRSSEGPVIYKQTRVGYQKKPFNIYKFRTMYVNSEPNGPMLSTADDKRITRVGRILRKYRLDELPQFWNVLRGDMSLVGPRPEREYYLSQIIDHIPYYSLLLQVRPGITSWGMVKYGYASNVEQMIDRAKYDIFYVDNVSLIVDLKILLHTVETIVTGRGI